jgi:hypothetical protein
MMSVLETVVLIGHVDGPSELFPLRFVEDLFDGNVMFFAPGMGKTVWNEQCSVKRPNFKRK